MYKLIPRCSVAVGVDIGKEAYHVCVADPTTQVKSWPVHEIDLKRPDWHERLRRLIPADALILHEPTGWAYSLPLRRALSLYGREPEIWLINHVASAASRRLYVSRAKNDTLDARAIARIALDIVNGDDVRGVRRDDPKMQDAVLSLRLMLNHRRRVTKVSTRLSNQLDALAHSIWPLLSQKKATYLRCVAEGAVTPAEIRAMAEHKPADIVGRSAAALKMICDEVPDVVVHPQIRASIITLYAEYQAQMTKRQALEDTIEGVLLSEFKDITQRWQTVPGAGALYIAALIVGTNGMYAELTPEQFKASVGVAPNTGRSGSVDKTRRGRAGSVHSKDALHMWTMYLVNDSAPPNVIRSYYTAGHKLAHCKRKLAEILSGIARNPRGAWRG
ncbi:MAG: transposase [Anaerolinea sp.]